MSAFYQIITIIINLFLGIFLFYFSLVNYKFINKEPLILKLLITLLFCLDFTFIYLFIFYKLVDGIFNLYYFIYLTIGYFLGYKLYKNVKLMSNLKLILDKLKIKK